MALPRHIEPGKIYLIRRRIRLGHPLFRPDSALIAQIVAYSLAEAAVHHPVEIHAVGVMLDHLVLVVTDTLGAMPAFFERAHSHIACCTMAHRGLDEAIFAPGSYQAEELNEVEDVLDALAEVAAAPVVLGLVERPERWPGLLAGPGLRAEGRLEAVRPPVYFGPRTTLPERARLVLETPAPCRAMDEAQYVAAVEDLVASKCAQARAAMRKAGRRCPGAKAVVKVPLHEPWRCERTRAVHREARQIQRRFVREGRAAWYACYRTQRRRWIASKGVCLPGGSYALPAHFNVEVRPLSDFVPPCALEAEARARARLGRVARRAAAAAGQ